MDNKVKNRIILFSNLKGGTGKTTLCALFATYCVSKGIGVAMVDADIQQSISRLRSRELSNMENPQEPWQIISLDTSSVKGVELMMENLKSIPGWILVDCPGNLNDNGLLPIFKAADIVISPLSYENIVIDATSLFIKVFRKVSEAPVLLLPNRINDAEGTKAEREQRISIIKSLGQLGSIMPRIKQSVAIKRFSTIYSLDRSQTKYVQEAFDAIIRTLG